MLKPSFQTESQPSESTSFRFWVVFLVRLGVTEAFFKASSSCLSHSFCLGAFQLRYWSRGEKEDMASVQRTVGNQTSTVIRGVKGSTTYYVSVRAYNTAGTGPPSSTVNVTTKKPRKYLMKPSAISTRLILYFS